VYDLFIICGNLGDITVTAVQICSFIPPTFAQGSLMVLLFVITVSLEYMCTVCTQVTQCLYTLDIMLFLDFVH
jgi:hypothetical protein